MAIRVLARHHFHRILAENSQFSLSATRKIRFFSTSSSVCRKILPEIAGVPVASVLRRYGFPQSQTNEFIAQNQFLFNYASSDVEKCVGILLSFGLSEKSMLSILYSNPMVLDIEFLRKWQLGLSELSFPTISPSLVQTLLEQSEKLNLEPGDICRSVSSLKNMSFSDYTVVRVLEQCPVAFRRGTIYIQHKVEFLKKIGVNGNEIDRICFRFPGYLAFSVETRLKPLFQEFRDLGFGLNEIRKALISNPKLLGMEVGELSCCLDLIKSLKCRAAIKDKILSHGPLKAAVAVKLRVDCLCKYGLIRRDTFKILFVEPRAILHEVDDMEKKIEFLLHNLGYSIQCLVEFPEYLGVNLEKWIVPRCNVVDYLRSIGGLGFEVGMKHLVKLSRHKFYDLLVKPYPECEEIFRGPKREVKVNARHPAGLWKLFKPQKFHDSAEDVKNMKLFMKSLV